MKELENMEEIFNQFSNYLEDKICGHHYIKEGASDCCGAGVYVDLMICSECQDHCQYAPEMCRGCGDVEVDKETDGLCCSDDCWKLYCSETFYDD